MMLGCFKGFVCGVLLCGIFSVGGGLFCYDLSMECFKLLLLGDLVC